MDGVRSMPAFVSNGKFNFVTALRAIVISFLVIHLNGSSAIEAQLAEEVNDDREEYGGQRRFLIFWIFS